MRYQGRAYISGPMTGYPGYNYAAFDAAEPVLEAEGYDVINLARNFGGRADHPGGRAAYMRLDVGHVLDADLVFVLPGWEKSRGARLEILTAQELGLPVFDFVTREPVDNRVVTYVRAAA